jgi:hypothetical protein
VNDVPHDAGDDRNPGAEGDLRQYGEQAARRRDDAWREPAPPRDLVGASFLFSRNERLFRELTRAYGIRPLRLRMTGRERQAEMVPQQGMKAQRTRKRHRRTNEPDVHLTFADQLGQFLHGKLARIKMHARPGAGKSAYLVLKHSRKGGRPDVADLHAADLAPAGPSPDALGLGKLLEDIPRLAELLASLLRSPQTRAFALRLMSRDLPKRAFAIFRDAWEPFVRLNDVFDASDWSRSGDGSRLSELDVQYARQGAWRLFNQIVPIDPIEQPRRIRELGHAIKAAAIAARTILDDAAPAAGNEPFIGIAPRVFIEPINEVLVREKNSIGYSAQWTKSEELTTADNVARGIDHIYTDRDWLEAVAIACIKVLYDFRADGLETEIQDKGDDSGMYDEASFKIVPRVNLRIDDICSRIGLDRQSLFRKLTKVASTDYFRGAIRAVPLAPEMVICTSDVAERYAKFSGERSWRVSERSVTGFVRQFPLALRKEVLDLLMKGEMLGRGSTREAMDKLCSAFAEKHHKKPVICRFSPNSGNHVGMILEQERLADYQNRGWMFARSLAELELRVGEGADCAIFVDDQFATGGQAEAQLFHWSGRPRAD